MTDNNMSRIGRNYLEVGFYTEVLFRKKNVRFIAISNNVDSALNDGSNEFAPFLNIMNEWYVRDTSRKIKSVLHNKGMEGKHLTSNAIYGYKKDPDNPDRWIIDEEAATVVRRIYQLIIEGNGPMQVARILKDEKVERPSYYLAKQGLGTCRGSCDMSRPYTWTTTTVSDIVRKPEYMGHTVNFRTKKLSYKDKNSVHNSPEDWYTVLTAVLRCSTTAPVVMKRRIRMVIQPESTPMHRTITPVPLTVRQRANLKTDVHSIM